MSKSRKNPITEAKKRPTIGFFDLEIGGDWALWPWLGIVDAARKHDVNLVTFVGQAVGMNQANVVYDLARGGRLDGLVFWKAGLVMALTEAEIETFCRQYRIPIVTMEGSLSGSPCVSYENYLGLRKATEHLIKVHRYRKVGFLGMYEHHTGFQDRYRGYKDAMQAHGFPIDPALAIPWFPREQVKRAMIEEQRLDNYLDHAIAQGVEAIIGIADSIACQVQGKLQERGIRVPEEVAVVGFDNAYESHILTPPLTTISAPFYELGYTAAETLIDLLAGKSVPELVNVPSDLIVRQSCGCQDSYVAAVTANPGHTPATSLVDTDTLIHPEIAAELVEAAQASGIESIQHEAEPLLEKFAVEITGKETGIFLNAVEHVLQRSTDTVDELSKWHNVISTLRQQVSPRLSHNGEETQRAETLLQQAQVLISRVAERTQMSRSFRADQKQDNLRKVGLSLITTMDVNALMDTLASGLPDLEIPSCYLSLFENPKSYRYPDPAPEWARLVLAYDPQERAQLEPQGQRFPTRQLIPDELWPQDRACSFVLLSLHFQEEQIGYVLFESGSRNGRMYETLGTQISSALKGALLVQRVQENAAEITRQKYVLDTFMDNVPDTIYFKDRDSRFTQVNRAFANRFGIDQPTDVLGKTDFDFFADDIARPKYEQEQEIIRTGQPVIGLEEPDAGNRWVLTTKMPLRNERDEIIGTFGISRDITELRQAQKDIEIANQALELQIWQTTGQAELNDKMRGEQDVETLANNVVQQLCQYLGAQVGVLYVAQDDILKRAGSYAYSNGDSAKQFKFGEGLVGQVAIEKQPMVIRNVPGDHIAIRSGLVDTIPKVVMIYPFMYEDQVMGVVEMGTLTEFGETEMEFLQAALASIAIAFNTAQARARIDELLHETQQQAEELQAQGEELRVANEELESQTESLRTSEAQLREKQAVLDEQNRALKVAQQELERKAKELALASKYKSEFLSNMSHELRTPLNSLLILARMLSDNDDGNLTEEQVESAHIIYGSGNDLLNLINDILDLSKVEAGKMTFTIEPMPLTDLVTTVRTQFTHVAEEKGVDLNITLADDLPVLIETDQQRVNQIVKNLLSNAFKFTSEGSVSLDIYRPDAGVDLSQSGLDPSQAVAIRVADTGIGMTPEQQKIVFEAFQQADGSTSRMYGGTGLGLSISRELAAKLGGQITLESEANRGSTFTLYLPITGPWGTSGSESTSVSSAPPPQVEPSRGARLEPRRESQDDHQKTTDSPPVQPSSSPAPALPDDRADLEAGDKTLLVIEDDPRFAKVVYDHAHQQGFKCLIAGDGRTGLELVKTYRPEAVILDLNLPDISGWEVLEMLKHDPDTRHIPVHIISVDEEVLSAYRKGAMGYLTKPVSRESLIESFQSIEQFISREIKSLLLVEDDAKSRSSIKKLLGGSDVQIVEADRGQTALDLLKEQRFDCMIVDLNLPDMTGFQVLNEMNGDGTVTKCPVIVYTGRDLTPEENHELMKYADSVIVKGVKSPERLLDETSLFLHRVVADMPKAKQQTIKQLYNGDVQLEGKKILIVDDDMRNSFALSKLLSDKGIDVKIAQSGQKALDLLAEHRDMDLVLMDIMMPVMDGYETIQRIRAQQEFKTLPILALTAKAMKGDREKCLDAGASDYLSKPIDVDRLFSMLRVWLYQ